MDGVTLETDATTTTNAHSIRTRTSIISSNTIVYRDHTNKHKRNIFLIKESNNRY